MKVVCIAGVGLIGGSFALALREAGFTGKIIGVSSPATVEKALSLGVIDQALPLSEAAALADLVYLAQPISQILTTLDAALLAGMAPHLLAGLKGGVAYFNDGPQGRFGKPFTALQDGQARLFLDAWGASAEPPQRAR